MSAALANFGAKLFDRLHPYSGDKFVRRVERIRNKLAHSQNSIISNMSWGNFVKTISLAENYLIISDNEVERIAKEGNEFEDMLI